jgi:hypothetical protein
MMRYHFRMDSYWLKILEDFMNFGWYKMEIMEILMKIKNQEILSFKNLEGFCRVIYNNKFEK